MEAAIGEINMMQPKANPAVFCEVMYLICRTNEMVMLYRLKMMKVNKNSLVQELPILIILYLADNYNLSLNTSSNWFNFG
jgi:hypothetical protein